MNIKSVTARMFIVPLAGFGFATMSFGDDSSKAANPPKSNPITSPLTAFADNGVTFPITYTGEVQGDVSGGYRRGATYDGLLQVAVQLDLEKLAGWKGASFYTSFLDPDGESLTDRYVHSFNRVSGIDANHDPRLYELWFQQNFDNGRFSIRIGQFLADDDFYVTSYGGAFVNGAFSAIPIVTSNIDAPTFPVAAPGVRLRYAPDDSFQALFAAFTADAGNQYTNRHGTRFFQGSSGALLIGELDYTLNPPAHSSGDDGKQQAPATRPLSGTYKLGGYYDTGHFADLNGVTGHRGDYAFYAIVNQEIWHEPGDPVQGLRLFGQIGAAPDDRNAVCIYCDGGINYLGIIPTRDKDIFALGTSFTKISENLLTTAGTPVASHYETIVEATYQFVVNDHLSVQPDFQYIINPGATARIPNAVVAGVRFSITF